jgi:tape measure domain-containing protein
VADGDVSLRYRLLGSDEGASRAFDKVGKSSDHLSTKMVAVGTAIGHLAAGGIMALGGMAAGAVKTGIQTAAAMQQAQLGFATLLHSETAAGDYMKWLTGFAASTPFEMKGLVESSRTLIGVGVSAGQTKTMLQDFGDAASAVGIQQDAFQRIMLATSQAISAGKFQAGDLNQIMTNGLPVWTILSKAMHKTVPELRDMASHGKLLAKDVLPALQSQMHKDYGGAMAKQSQTLNGLWSTFQDTIHLGMANILKPLIPIMQRVLPGAMETLGKAFQTGATAVKGFIDGVGGGGGKGLSGAAASFHDLGVKAREAFGQIRTAIQFVVDHKDAFGALAAGAAAGIGTFKVLSLAMSAYSAVMTIATVAQTLYAIATGTATAAQLGLDVALSPVLITIGAFVIVIAALAAGLIYAYTQSETFRNVINGAFGAVKDFVVGAVDTIKGAWDAFVGGFQNPGATIGKSVDAISRIFLTLGSVVGTVVGWFQALPGRILAGVAALPGLLWAFIKSTVEKAAYLFGFGLGLLVRASIELPQKIAAALIKLPGLVWDIMKTVATKGAQAFASFVTAVVGKAIDLASQVPAKVSAMVAAVVGFLRGLPAKAVAAIKALPGLVKSAVSDAGKWLLDAGKQIVMGMVNGIKNAAGAAVSAVKDIGGNIIKGFSDAVGWNSPAKKFIPIGSGIIEGVEVGLKSRAPAVYNFMERFAQRIGDMKVTARVKDKIEKIVSDTAEDMRGVTSHLDRVTQQIKDQQAKIADLIKAKADYANQLAQGISGGGITSFGLLKLDEQGRNADAQQKVTDASDAATRSTDALTQAQGRLADLQEQAAARTSDSVAQLQALRDAQQAVTDAQTAAADAQKKLDDAKTAATTATTDPAVDLLEKMKARVRAIHTFADNMDALKAKGLSEDVLQQIAQSGLDAGSATAASLVNATPETIQGIDAMSAQISASSKRFGDEWSGEMYDNGLNASKGMLEGFKSKHDELIKAARDTANEMNKEIKKVLKIKSPSAVMRDEVGAQIAAGLAAGIRGGAGGVASAMRSLVAIPSVGARIGLGGSIAGAGGAGVTNVHLHVPNGFVGSPDQLATALSDVISRAKARGLNLSFA